MADLARARHNQNQYDAISVYVKSMNNDPLSKPSVWEAELEEVFLKYIAGQQYLTNDVKKVAENMLTKMEEDYKKDFKNVFIATSDDAELREHIKSKIDRQFILCIYRLQGTSNWVTFVITKFEHAKRKLFYIDSTGEKIPKEIEEVLFKIVLPECQFYSNANYLEEGDLKLNPKQEGFIKAIDFSGPIAIRNLNKMIKKLMYFIIDDFEYFEEEDLLTGVNFWTQKKLTTQKLDLARFCATTLGFNHRFQNALGHFTRNDLPEIKDIMEKGKKYRENMSDANKSGSISSQEDVDNLRKKNFGSSDYSSRLKNKKNVYEIELTVIFRRECHLLQIIFRVLECCSFDESCKDAVDYIADIFNLSKDDLDSFYSYIKEQNEANDGKIPEPKFTDPNPKDYGQEAGIKSIDQVIEELSFGVEENSVERKRRLKSAYNLFMKLHKKWSKKPLIDIQDYADIKRGNLGHDEFAICEALAVLNRLLKLEKGYYMRDTHLVTFLLALIKPKESKDSDVRGKLFQIKTGEGKTNIVGLLCAIKVLQGHSVDVITSNPVLAREGAESNKNYFAALSITVSTNNPDRDYESKNEKTPNAYLHDVVYGDISNFQFDYLRDKFEDLNKLRKFRKFDQVVIDEVDSMLIDNGGHIAKLAEPYPGMEALRYIYVKIWTELQKEIEKNETIYKNNLEIKLRQIADEIKMGLSQEEANDKIEKYIESTIPTAENLLNAVRKSDPLQCPLLPEHVREYAKAKLDKWIRLAIHTHYSCFENEQYRILNETMPNNQIDQEIADAEREGIQTETVPRIVPVDYENTGVTLMNTIWSNGHHQFVQLKHNCRLTYESLTSSYISNIGYIKLYGSKNLIGVSGTLGSKPEQDLLSSVYNLEYIHVPTYKKKQFNEEDGIIVEDQYWASTVVSETTQELLKNRAVLLICLTIKDHNILKSMFEQCRTMNLYQNLEIRSVFDKETIKKATKTKIGPNTVVIATNIAGRGTNFKTLKSVEKAGGLHVIVTFVPCNERVEDQAFGRTSRQGHKGSAMLIIKGSEARNLRLQTDATIADVKNMRNENESKRLENIRSRELLKIQRKDELFELFAQFYMTEKVKLARDFQRDLIMRDITESWARWLDQKTSESIDDQGQSDDGFYHMALNSTANNLFEEFKNQYSLKSTDFKYIRCKNPFYDIIRALILTDDDINFSLVLLQDCMKGREENYRPLFYGAYMGLFEITMRTSKQAEKIIKGRIKDVITFGLDSDAIGTEYLTTAKEYLEDAAKCLESEISYIEREFGFSESGNKDFQKIIVEQEQDNHFLSQIRSRLTALYLYKNNAEELCGQLSKLAVDKDGHALIDVKSKNFFTGLQKSDRKLLRTPELQELRDIGLEAVYSLKIVYNMSDTKLKWALGFIGSGFVMIGTCAIFPFMAPIMLPVGIGLICEGFADIIFEAFKDDSKPDDASFITEKLISLGTTLITVIFSAAKVAQKLLSMAIKACDAAKRVLERGNKICKFFLDIVNTIQTKLKSALDKLKAGMKLAKSLKDRKSVFKYAVKELGKRAKNAIKHAFLDMATGFISDNILDTLKSSIVTVILDTMKQKEYRRLSRKLKKAKKSSVDEIIEGCFNATTEFFRVFKYMANFIKSVKESMKSKKNIFKAAVNIAFDISKSSEIFGKNGVGLINSNVFNYIDKYLENEGQNRQLHVAQQDTAEKIADKIIENIKNISSSVVDIKNMFPSIKRSKHGIKNKNKKEKKHQDYQHNKATENKKKNTHKKSFVELESKLAERMENYIESKVGDLTENNSDIDETAAAIISTYMSTTGEPIDITSIWKKVYTMAVLTQTEGVDLRPHVVEKPLPKTNKKKPKSSKRNKQTSRLPEKKSTKSEAENNGNKLMKLKASIKQFLDDLDAEESFDSSSANIRTRYAIESVQGMKDFFKNVGHKILNNDE